MAYIQWIDEFKVNVRVIDEQHKKLIDLINELHDAMKQAQGKAILSKVFLELIHYADYHFKTEEELFEKYNYPQFAEHKLQHDGLRNSVLELKQKFESGYVTITIEVMKFLKGWIENHILNTDKSYSKFFNEQGLV